MKEEFAEVEVIAELGSFENNLIYEGLDYVFKNKNYTISQRKRANSLMCAMNKNHSLKQIIEPKTLYDIGKYLPGVQKRFEKLSSFEFKLIEIVFEHTNDLKTRCNCRFCTLTLIVMKELELGIYDPANL